MLWTREKKKKMNEREQIRVCKNEQNVSNWGTCKISSLIRHVVPQFAILSRIGADIMVYQIRQT